MRTAHDARNKTEPADHLRRGIVLAKVETYRMTKGIWACARICLFHSCYSWCREDSGSDLDEDSNVVSERALGGDGRRNIEFLTYKMANFLGVTMRTGSKAKQMTKQAKAAKLQAPNTSSRSHLLTASACQSKSYHIEKWIDLGLL
jgi:hypothetical protein